MARPSHRLPLSSKKHIDQVCLRFEAACQEGAHPAIETYLAEVTEPEFSALLVELLLLDLDYRLRAGETPQAGQYSPRFPGHARIVEEVFRQCGLMPEASGTCIGEFGGYELLEVIGRGGMGIVYRARQVGLDRIVALKMIRAGRLASRDDVERFQQEAQAAAGLQHPNIIAIHEVGEHEEQHYFSMDYVDGTNLAEIVNAGPLAARRAAQYVQTMAAAVEYAHQRGILHRDLKPSNVIIDAADQPHITDFGLARRIEAVSDLTASGQVLGTPSYMSPEQAAGHLAEVSPASDVYGLGATLYELLTGRPPFRGETAVVTLSHVLEQEPVPPRRLNPAVPRDLDVICLRCLQKDPKRRYASARELADDLGRFLRGEPIRARPVGAPTRLARWCRRRPLVSGLVCALLLTLLGGTAVSTYFALEAGARARAATERLWQSYLAQARASRRTGRLGQRFESLEALASAAAIRPAPELRDEAIACMALFDLRPIRRWTVQRTVVGLTDAGMTRYACGDGRGNISIRRVADDCEEVLLPSPDGRPAAVYCRFSLDGRFLLSWHDPWQGQPAQCRVWDIARGQVTLQAPSLEGQACDIAPDGSAVAVVGPDGTIGVFDPATGERLESVPWELSVAEIPTRLRFHPQSKRLAAFSWPQPRLHFVDLQAGKVIHTCSLPTAIRDCAWHPHEDVLAVSCDDWKIRVIDAETGEVRSTLTGHQAEVMGVRFSPSGEFLASRSWDGTARFWEFSSGRQLLQMDGFYVALEFSGDGRKLLSRTRYGELEILEVGGGREYRTIPNPGQESKWPECLCFSPDGRWLATSDSTGVRLWAAESFRPVADLPLGPTRQVLFAARGPSLLTLGAGGIQQWPISHDPQSHRFRIGPPVSLDPVPGAAYVRLSLSANSHFLGATLDYGKVVRFPLESPAQAVVLGDHAAAQFISVSPDGRYLATGTWQGSGVKVWDCRNGRLAVELSAAERADVTFSPDGRWLLTSTDYEYRLWNVGTWTSDVRIARPFPDLLGAAAFSPDSRLLALGHTRFAVHLVDPTTGLALGTLESPDTTHYGGLFFSPDGTRLATGGGNMVRVWDLSEIGRHLETLHLKEAGLPLRRLEPDRREEMRAVEVVLE